MKDYWENFNNSTDDDEEDLRITNFLEAVAGKGGHMTGNVQVKIPGEINFPRILQFSKDGKTLTLSSYANGIEGTVDFYDDVVLKEVISTTEAVYGGVVRTDSKGSIKLEADATVKIYGNKNMILAEIYSEGSIKYMITQDYVLTGITQTGAGYLFNGFDAVEHYNGMYDHLNPSNN